MEREAISSIPTCVKGFVMRKFLILAIVGSNFIFCRQVMRPIASSRRRPVLPRSGRSAGPARADLAPYRTQRRHHRSGQRDPADVRSRQGDPDPARAAGSNGFRRKPRYRRRAGKSPSLIYVNAKAPGETVLYAVDADDNVLAERAGACRARREPAASVAELPDAGREHRGRLGREFARRRAAASQPPAAPKRPAPSPPRLPPT